MNKWMGWAIVATGAVFGCNKAIAANDLVISQAYALGNTTGATYNADFVEIFNRGSSAQPLTGLTIQYASATGTGNFQVVATLSGSLNPGQFALLRMGAAGAIGAALPTQDYASGSGINNSAGGKVIIANSTTALTCNGSIGQPCSVPQLALIVDLVGIGSANFFEGSGVAPLGSATLSPQRTDAGCTDADNNSADFATATPIARNTSSALAPCASTAPYPITVSALSVEGLNALATTGTSDTLPTGFAIEETGGDGLYAADDGSNVNDGIYSYGTGVNSERALGTMRLSGARGITVEPFIGRKLSNNTGDTIKYLYIRYVGEQWRRNGADGIADRLDFQYSTDATSLTTGTWTDVDALDFVSPDTSAATTARDGNDSAYQTDISAWIETLNIANGASFWIRWTDDNSTAASDGLAIDDLAIAVPAISLSATTSGVEGSTGSCPDPNLLSPTVSRVGNSVPSTGIPYAFAITDVTTTAGSDYTGATSGSLTLLAAATVSHVDIPVVCDDIDEPDESFTVTISTAAGSGYFVLPGAASGTGTITDDDEPVLPTISIGDRMAPEGSAGPNTFNFPVTLSSAAPSGGVNFTVNTSDGTATSAGSDYTALVAVAGSIAEGATNTVVAVTVNGDTTPEATENFTVTLSAVSNVNVAGSDLIATGTIQNDDFNLLTIEDIQGNGHASPYANQPVETLGNIVTAVLPAPNGGFVMQMPDASATGDTATSNGIYVYTGGAPVAVAVGDAVNVRGVVIEFSTSGSAPASARVTEFTNTGLVYTVTSSGNPLPEAIVLDAARPSPNPATPSCGAVGNFECYEGMRVTTSTGMVNLGNQTFGGDTVAEMWITTSGQRAVREGGLLPNKATETVPTLTPAAPALPTTYLYDLNPEVFELDMDRAGLPNTVLVPGTTFSATGVLVQEFGGFELWPTALTVDTATPALPAPVVDALPTELTIGSQNLHLLFDDVNDAWNTEDCSGTPDPDFCPDTTRWNAKLNLLSRQIREQLKSPMVVAVQEVEKQGALDALANKINADLGIGSSFTYAAHVGDIENLDGGHQNVGFLIRSDVNVLSLTQLNTTQTWTFNGSPQGEVMDRPPYLLRATVELVSGAPFEFAVMALHQRSLSGIDNLSTSVDPDNSPLTYIQNAHRVRQKRLYQAALTAQGIQQFQSANPDVPLYVLGDFNAYTASDGYADVTGIIQGTTDPALSQYDLSFFSLEGSGPNGNIVVPPLTSASALAPADERYSYQFQSMPQQIDHAMMNAAGVERFLDIHFARNNVDQQARYLISFNNSLGTETPLVSSDHDGFVLYVDPRANELFKDGFED